MPTAKKKKKQGGGFWRGLLLLGIGWTGGMFAAATIAIYVNELHIPFIEPPTRKAQQGGQQLPSNQREEVQFHDILKNNQPTPLPVQPLPSAALPQQLPQANTDGGSATSQFVFYLQIGAFQQQAAAEALRAELVLGGQQGIIKNAQLADGSLVYRVWLGPYEKELDAEKERAQLALTGHPNATLLKVRQ